MPFIKRILGIRLDVVVAAFVVILAVCFNSCSALSTCLGFSSLGLPLAVIGCLVLALFPDAPDGRGLASIGAILIVVPIVLSAVANFGYSNASNSLNLIAVIALAYLCVRKVGANRFCSTFVTLICVTSVFSVAMWVALNVLNLSLPLPVLENVNGVHYKTLIVATQYVESYIENSFSMGFFWECGVFASYVLLAMAIELITVERPSKLKMAVLLLALLTTGSTAGYLLLPLVACIGLLKHGGKVQCVIALGLALILVLAVINYEALLSWIVGLNPDIFGKLVASDAVTRLSRMQSPAACWLLFQSKPLFGFGYGDALDAYSAIAASSSTIDSLTSTSAFQLSAFGLGGFLIWAVFAYAVFGNGRIVGLDKIVLFALFVVIINKEPHTASCLTYGLVFALLAGCRPPIKASTINEGRDCGLEP